MKLMLELTFETWFCPMSSSSFLPTPFFLMHAFITTWFWRFLIYSLQPPFRLLWRRNRASFHRWRQCGSVVRVVSLDLEGFEYLSFGAQSFFWCTGSALWLTDFTIFETNDDALLSELNLLLQVNRDPMFAETSWIVRLSVVQSMLSIKTF